MKQFFAVIFVVCFCTTSFSQYYYNDIISNQLTNKQQKLLLQNKINKVKIINKDADETLVEGFLVEQKINADATEIITITTSQSGAKSTFIAIYNSGKVTQTTDDNTGVQTTTTFVYLDDGKLNSVESYSKDTFMNSYMQEQHIWKYNTKNQPQQMLRIKNQKDTTMVNFVYDEKGLVAAETWIRKGKPIENYYYYYNEKGSLTDIARYNNRLQKIIPDFIFEYDQQGNLLQTTQVKPASNDYTKWKYFYNANGLKQKEICYDKKKQILGILEYTYN